MAVKPVPQGHNSVSPYLIVDDVAKLIEFTKRTFQAEELERRVGADGAISHAEVRIGDSVVMMGESRGRLPPMVSSVHVYLADTDEAYRRALDAGATSISPPTDQPYGDRTAGVRDPLGNMWWIGTHQEDVSPEEMARRFAAKAASGS